MVNSRDNEIQKQRDRIDTQQDHISGLQEKVFNLRSENELIKRDVRMNEKEMMHLKTLCNDLRLEMVQMANSYDQRNQENQILRNEFEKLRSEVKESTKKSKTGDETVKKLKDDIRLCKKLYNEMRHEYFESLKALETERLNQSVKAQQFEGLENQMEVFRAEFSQMKSLLQNTNIDQLVKKRLKRYKEKLHDETLRDIEPILQALSKTQNFAKKSANDESDFGANFNMFDQAHTVKSHNGTIMTKDLEDLIPSKDTTISNLGLKKSISDADYFSDENPFNATGQSRDRKHHSEIRTTTSKAHKNQFDESFSGIDTIKSRRELPKSVPKFLEVSMVETKNASPCLLDSSTVNAALDRQMESREHIQGHEYQTLNQGNISEFCESLTQKVQRKKKSGQREDKQHQQAWTSGNMSFTEEHKQKMGLNRSFQVKYGEKSSGERRAESRGNIAGDRLDKGFKRSNTSFYRLQDSPRENLKEKIQGDGSDEENIGEYKVLEDKVKYLKNKRKYLENKIRAEKTLDQDASLISEVADSKLPAPQTWSPTSLQQFLNSTKSSSYVHANLNVSGLLNATQDTQLGGVGGSTMSNVNELNATGKHSISKMQSSLDQSSTELIYTDITGSQQQSTSFHDEFGMLDAEGTGSHLGNRLSMSAQLSPSSTSVAKKRMNATGYQTQGYLATAMSNSSTMGAQHMRPRGRSIPTKKQNMDAYVPAKYRRDNRTRNDDYPRFYQENDDTGDDNIFDIVVDDRNSTLRSGISKDGQNWSTMGSSGEQNSGEQTKQDRIDEEKLKIKRLACHKKSFTFMPNKSNSGSGTSFMDHNYESKEALSTVISSRAGFDGEGDGMYHSDRYDEDED
mmetsp:Transcript_14922/g.16555  ORF Transcript_14922/g.16555 Transcript_14922/m.16555 type:complete len:853 (+) Transcript_14922:1-2559(+)